MGFINPRSLVRFQFPPHLRNKINSQNMDKTKKEKEDKVVRVDIRKIPRRSRVGVPSLFLTIILTLLLAGGIYIFRVLGFKGEEVSVSQIVMDVSEGNYCQE